jgi:hypothetical protein
MPKNPTNKNIEKLKAALIKMQQQTATDKKKKKKCSR